MNSERQYSCPENQMAKETSDKPNCVSDKTVTVASRRGPLALTVLYIKLTQVRWHQPPDIAAPAASDIKSVALPTIERDWYTWL